MALGRDRAVRLRCQTDLPEKETAAEYSLITITLTDAETGEMGEGSVFFRHARMK